MTDLLISLLALGVTLGILITFHEFGHFWVARRLGVKVLRFSVGFGRPLWLRRGLKDNTEYVIAAIPLGGYVRMLDEREGEVSANERHRAFNRKPVSHRIAIVAAGPGFNFLFAILAYALMFMIGIAGTKPLLGTAEPGSIAEAGGFQKGDLIMAVDGQSTLTVNDVHMALLEESLDGGLVQVQVRDDEGRIRDRVLDLNDVQGLMDEGPLFPKLGLSLWPIPAVIGEIAEDSPAERAGLQRGDRIVAIDEIAIESWEELVSYVQVRPGQALDVSVQRDGRTQTFELTPVAVDTEQGTIGRMGVGGQVPEDIAETLRIVVRYNPFQAVWEAVRRTWDVSLFTLRMLGYMLIGQAPLENISGPITIAQYAGQSASIGWIPFLSFLALVSVSLGVLNLLPVPVLDGGHLLYYFIEVIKGGPLPDFVQEIGQRLGIVLIFLLMSLALFNDLVRLLE